MKVAIHSDYRIMIFLNNKFKNIFIHHFLIMGLKIFNNYICVSKHLKDLTWDIKMDLKGNKFVVNIGVDF